MANTKAVRYRLALDLGMTSLGWAVLRLSADNVPTAVIRAGVRIFHDGRAAKDGTSLAVERRKARLMRRRRDRLLRRKARMMQKLIDHGFFPHDAEARKALERLNPYELRAKALREALTPNEFARALFHLNQRRGFKSNRKTDVKVQDDKENSALKSAIAEVRKKLADDGCQTIGEWLWQRLQNKQTVRARKHEVSKTQAAKVSAQDKQGASKVSYDLYIDRQMVLDEFDAIWSKQAQLQPALFTDAAREELRNTLEFQRPLRPVKPGRCTLIPEEERAALALPSQQRFRILQEVNHLRILDSNLQGQPLTIAQRDAIVELLEVKAKVSFTAMRKTLQLDSGARFNLEDGQDGKRQDLKGNTTSVMLAKKEHFGTAWHGFDLDRQDAIVSQLLNEENEAVLVQWLQTHTAVDVQTAERIANARLMDGYGRLSQQALARILPALLAVDADTGLPRTYDKAVQAAGFAHHSRLGYDFAFEPDEVEYAGEYIHPDTGEITAVHAFKQLPYYGRALTRHVAFAKENPRNDEERYGKIANPTVHIGLNQVRVVVNALIRRYGRPTEIVVELARELKQSQKQKKEADEKHKANKKRKDYIRKEIAKSLNISPELVHSTDIEKWILWEELNPSDVAGRCCPYSGKTISAEMLFDGRVEIEHILPFSRTLDNSRNNKTVALRSANRLKGNRTPWEARNAFAHEGWAYDDILRRASQMAKGKSYRFAPDGYEQWLRKDKDFLARALNDTRYLSRIACVYLELVCPYTIENGQGVRVIPGHMTALLRSKLGLNKLLGRATKNREDHRHHAIDACVIGVTDQGLLQRFASASAATWEKGLENLAETMPLPWPTYWTHVQRAIKHIIVSYKPDHGHEGAMHKDTAYRLYKKDTNDMAEHGKYISVLNTKGVDNAADGDVSDVSDDDSESRDKKKKYQNVLAFSNQKARRSINHLWFDSVHHRPPAPYKGYVTGSNFCMEIVLNVKGKWEGEVISTFEAYQLERKLRTQYAAQYGKDAPALPLLQLMDKLLTGKSSQTGRPLVMRLMINDCVRMQVGDGGCLEIMRVCAIKQNGEILFASHQEGNVDARNRSKEDPFKYVSKKAGSLQKAQARRVTISPIGDVRVLASKPPPKMQP